MGAIVALILPVGNTARTLQIPRYCPDMTAHEALPDPVVLEAFINRCIDHFASDDARSIPLAHERDFRMIFGVCIQTVRYAEAYLVLYKQGLSLEARAIARSAIEHAATSEYAYFRVGGLDELAVSAERAGWSLNDRMHRWTRIAGYAPGPEPAKATGLPSMTKHNGTGLLRILDPKTIMFDPGYAILSQAVHVTEETITGFFRESHGSLTIYHRRDDDLAGLSIFLVAEACMLVTYIDAHLREDEKLMRELEFRSDQMRLPLRLDEDWPHELRSRRDKV